ncbi:hypothetical protein AB0758_33910 [Tolypothrix bouteillei VB521301_2]|uniref:hypothetical protein n=1 Tax=Tolypothrix bouteillei TaxID=1246981 RepID=UPI0038B47B4E
MRSRSGCFAASPNRQQRHQQLIEQYVFSRRTMLALLGFVCAPGLEHFIVGDTQPREPKLPANPQIPTLPQKNSLASQKERQQQLEIARSEYQHLDCQTLLGCQLYQSKRLLMGAIAIIGQA